VAQIEVIQDDITTLPVDAIVNAANSRLAGGGGVDGAIHRAAGRELLAECLRLGGCPTGDARITAGYALPARHVIHAVGPVWHGGGSGEAELLASCYRRSMQLAGEHNLRSVAFSALSCGVYGYPVDQAAHIAVTEVLTVLEQHPSIELVQFCCFGDAVTRAYRDALAKQQRSRAR
jgi:O-acetyl-ADP-ribose deacetylase (regulator of RNase III)